MDLFTKTIRVFISSSFQDMQQERDYLGDHVFHRLRAWLADRGWQLQAMDLRGSTPSPARSTEEAVLRMCLSGVDYCRPFFLCLLGDRYGWVPSGVRAEDTIDQICREAEGVMRESLLDKSATHMEVAYALQRMPHDRCFFYTRVATAPQDASFSEGIERQVRLKADIHTAMATSGNLQNCKTYCRGDDASAGADLRRLGDMVYADLLAAFDEELRDAGEDMVNPCEQARFYFRQKAAHFRPSALLQRVMEFAVSDADRNILLLSGVDGSGKSAVLAQSYLLLESLPCLMLPFVGGIGPGSFTIADMVDTFCQKLLRFLSERGVDPNPEPEQDYQYRRLSGLLQQVSTHTRILLMVDGLESMESTPDNHEFFWIGAGLTEEAKRSVRYILAVPNRNFLLTQPHYTLSVPAHQSRDDLEGCLTAGAARHGKGFDSHILALATHKASKNGTMLYANMLAHYLMTMTRADYAYSQSPTAHLEWMEAAIAAAGDSVADLFVLTVDRARKALGVVLVDQVLDILSVTPEGIREVNLLQALQCYARRAGTADAALSMDAALLSLRGMLGGHLSPFASGGYWRIEHGCIRDILARANLGRSFHSPEGPREDLIPFLHGLLVEVLAGVPDTDPFKREGYLQHCVACGDPRAGIEALANRADTPSPYLDRLWPMYQANPANITAWLLGVMDAAATRPRDFTGLYRWISTTLAENVKTSTDEVLLSQSLSPLLAAAAQLTAFDGAGAPELSWCRMQVLAAIVAFDDRAAQKAAVLTPKALRLWCGQLIDLCHAMLAHTRDPAERKRLHWRLAMSYARLLSILEEPPETLTHRQWTDHALAAVEQAAGGERPDRTYHSAVAMVYASLARYLAVQETASASETYDRVLQSVDRSMDKLKETMREDARRQRMAFNVYQDTLHRGLIYRYDAASFFFATGAVARATDILAQSMAMHLAFGQLVPPGWEQAAEFVQLQYWTAVMCIVALDFQAALPLMEAAVESGAPVAAYRADLSALQPVIVRTMAWCETLLGKDPAAHLSDPPDTSFDDLSATFALTLQRQTDPWLRSGNHRGAMLGLSLECFLLVWAGHWHDRTAFGDVIRRMTPIFADCIPESTRLANEYL